MENLIAIRYEGDDSLTPNQKLAILRFLNRILAGQKDAIIAANAHIIVVCMKEKVVSIEVIGTDEQLTKLINQKISNSAWEF